MKPGRAEATIAKGPDGAAPPPGRWLRRLTVCHAALGIVVYRRELGEIGSRGVLGAAPYRSSHAAAVWFIGSALPGWLVGHLVDVAAEAGDPAAVRTAATLGLAGGLGGALLMPASLSWIQLAVCGQMLRESRRLASGGPRAG